MTEMLFNAKELKDAVNILIERFDNLYVLESETNVSIELLEELKLKRISLDDVSITTVIALYEVSIKYGCTKEKENRFNHLNKSYYGNLPLTFPVTTQLFVVINDIAVLENEIPGITDEAKLCIKEYMFNHVNNAGFLIQKDGDIICCSDHDINLSCGTKCKATDNTYRFIRGLTRRTDYEVLYNLLTYKVIVYDMLNDRFLHYKQDKLHQYWIGYA